MVEKINPHETTALISQKADLEKATVSAVLRALREVVLEAVHDDKNISIGDNFGFFAVSHLKARKHKVPSKPGEIVVSDPHRKARFVFTSSAFKTF